MKHFVRIQYSMPELGGELLNIAELEEVSAHECTMVRMIELDPSEAITGIYVEGRVIGQPGAGPAGPDIGQMTEKYRKGHPLTSQLSHAPR